MFLARDSTSCVPRRLKKAWRFVLVAGVTLGCAEGILRIADPIPKGEYLVSSPAADYDPLLGYKNKPNARIRLIKKFNGDLISDSVYSTDEYGRRVILGPQRNGIRRSVLFFGCSFTFGEGVADNETLPFYVSQATSTYKVYNYGVAGYGPQQMLVELQDPELPNHVKEKEEVIAVYTFIDHHIQRVIGPMELMNYAGRFPYYRIDGQDRLVRNGTFISGRPLLTSLDVWLSKSALVHSSGDGSACRTSAKKMSG